MYRDLFQHIPNLITGARLVLAIVFFTILSWYQWEGRGDWVLLHLAFVIYSVALFSDFLDGYLARRWKVEGAFGRVVDPFVDKILVLGSFIFFAGKNFIIPEHGPGGSSELVVKTITGVTPAMVVILLGRELLVTSFRGLAESTGQSFGAAYSGKVKMVVQSITILIILVYVNYYAALRSWQPWPGVARDVAIWTTIVITVWSGLSYVRGGIAAARAPKASLERRKAEAAIEATANDASRT